MILGYPDNSCISPSFTCLWYVFYFRKAHTYYYVAYFSVGPMLKVPMQKNLNHSTSLLY